MDNFIEKIKSILEEYAFLKDEVKRCYHDMEEYEAKIENIEKQKIDLVEALACKTWTDMRQSAFRKRQRRKYLSSRK